MKKGKSFIILMLAAMMLASFASCQGQTKEEKNQTRVAALYDEFHQAFLSGTLPEKFGKEMIAVPLDEKLLQQASLSYPSEKRGGFTFDTVSFTDDGSIAFISTGEEAGAPYWGIVQERDARWYLIDEIYMSPLVTREMSSTRTMRKVFTIPSDWTVLAESEVDEIGMGTYYFIGVTFDEMVDHFRSCMNEGDTETVDSEYGDTGFLYLDENGEPLFDVLIWESIPGIPVMDLVDYEKKAAGEAKKAAEDAAAAKPV